MNLVGVNDYVILKPVGKSGVLTISETNLFEIVDSDNLQYNVGDQVIVESSALIEVYVLGEARYFIKSEHILAKVENGKVDNPSTSK